MKPILIVIGILMLMGGVLFLGPLIGLDLPISVPEIGPEVAGMPAVGLGLAALGFVLMIVGFKKGI